jgi:hypothetical protein
MKVGILLRFLSAFSVIELEQVANLNEEENIRYSYRDENSEWYAQQLSYNSYLKILNILISNFSKISLLRKLLRQTEIDVLVILSRNLKPHTFNSMYNKVEEKF